MPIFIKCLCDEYTYIIITVYEETGMKINKRAVISSVLLVVLSVVSARFGNDGASLPAADYTRSVQNVFASVDSESVTDADSLTALPKNGVRREVLEPIVKPPHCEG